MDENVLDIITHELSSTKNELFLKLKTIPKENKKPIERRIIRLKMIIDSLQKLNSIKQKNGY